MKSLIRFPFLFIAMVIRVIVVGGLSALFCVYTVDYLTSSAFGTFNLVIISFYFAIVCSFAVLFVEFFTVFQRRAKRKAVITKDKEKYGLK